MRKAIYRFFQAHYRRKYHGIYRHAKKLFVFDLALLAFTILLLGGGTFFYFWKPGIANLVNLSISFGDKRIKSGDKVCFNASYINHSKYVLQKSVLSWHLPKGFAPLQNDAALLPKTNSSSVATNETTNSTFELADIKPGEKGLVELCGSLWTAPGVEERIQAVLTFQSEKTKEPEQITAIALVNLGETVLKGNLVVSTTSLPNVPLEFVYTLTNTSDALVKNVNLKHNWIESVADEKKFQNISLGPRESKTVQGTIRLPSREQTYSLSLTPEISINNFLIPQDAVTQKIQVINPSVQCSITKAEDIVFVQTGQTIPVTISLKSNTLLTINNLRLTLSDDGARMVDWNATARDNHIKPTSDKLIVDKNVRTAFSSLNAKEEEQFVLNIRLLPRFSLKETDQPRLTLDGTLEASVPALAVPQVFKMDCAGFSLPLATELTLQSETRYYTAEGDQLGRGPLPPKVGQTTKYWIFAIINNTSNAVKDANFSATLAPGVSFTGKQSVSIGQPLLYNSTDGAVAWTHTSLPSYSQTGLYFEVAVTPGAGQLGQQLRLINGIRFKATDDLTGKQFNLSQAGLTNVLNSNDDGARMGARVAN